MSNPHSQGARVHRHPSSIIDKTGTGLLVLEMYNAGNSYSEIQRALWEKHSVKVSKMCIQRYVNKGDKRFQPSRVATSLDILRDSTIRKTADYYEHLNKLFEDFHLLVDTSKLSFQDKQIFKKHLDGKQKQIVYQFNEARSEIGLLFEGMMKHEEGINEFLLDFSRELCVDCRKKVSELIKKHEDANKIK